MCSHWQANSVASRRVCASRSIRRVWRQRASGLVQPPGRGDFAQFVVGQRRPEEIAQPARQFPVGDRRLAPRPAPAFRSDTRNAGATSTRASVRRNASSCGISCSRSLRVQARAARALRRRSADGDRPAPAKSSTRRAAAARQSTSRWRNAAARSLIGLRSGSNTLGSASCVAIFHQLREAHRPASAHPG